MPDYSQGKIYAIRSYITDDVYYGSTTNSLSKRIYEHKRCYKKWLITKKNYCSSFKIIEKDIDAYIELVENYSCNNKNELHKKEGEIIRANVCVNKRIDGRTKKEYRQDNKEVISQYQKQYREDNKEQIKQYRQDNKEVILELHKQYRENNKEKVKEQYKQHYQNNKEIILEQAKVKYTCECGSTLRISDKLRHEKTKKHQSFINSN